MTLRQVFKQFLKRDKLLVAPGCFDGLSARLVEEAGFEAAYLSGGAVARSMGIPDIGLVTMSESIERAVQVVSAIKIPIIADADTGYGNAVNLVRSVREFERAGVDAIFVEAPQSEEELAEIPRRVPDIPLLVNVFKGGKTPMLPMERLEKMG